MPRLFDNTNRNINFASSVNVGTSTNAALVWGWWYPTTLTATRRLWSVGAVWGAEIDTTTSEVRLSSDGNTTDGKWTTSGFGLAVDKWTFGAFLLNAQNTSSGPGQWRAWSGDTENPPTERTVSVATAQAGNITGTTQFYISNTSGTALALQGVVGDFCAIATSASKGTLHPLNLAANATITQAEADWTLRNFVHPAWARGEVPPFVRGTNSDITQIWSVKTDLAPRGFQASPNANTMNPFLVTDNLTSDTLIGRPRKSDWSLFAGAYVPSSQ